MNLNERKLRLIQFISELEDEAFFEYIESVIESSGERFGLKLPEIELNTSRNLETSKVSSEKLSKNEGEQLLADFYGKMADFKDKKNRRKIVFEKYTSEERLKIALMLRLEEHQNNPDDGIDGDIVLAEMRNKYKKNV